MKPEPPFGSLEWVMRAAGYAQPQATGCPTLERTGRHHYVLDLASRDAWPRCECGETLKEGEEA